MPSNPTTANEKLMKTNNLKAKIVIATIAVCLTGCATAPPGGYTALPNNRDYRASFDRVWGAIVSLASEKGGVKNIDKASGLLTTEEFNVGSGILTPNSLKQFAYEPPSFLGTWSEGRGSVTFFVTRHGELTNVRVTGRFAGFENNATHSWMEWPTKGTLENSILDRIGQMVGSGH
jgi:hypothetical protein